MIEIRFSKNIPFSLLKLLQDDTEFNDAMLHAAWNVLGVPDPLAKPAVYSLNFVETAPNGKGTRGIEATLRGVNDDDKRPYGASRKAMLAVLRDIIKKHGPNHPDGPRLLLNINATVYSTTRAYEGPDEWADGTGTPVTADGTALSPTLSK